MEKFNTAGIIILAAGTSSRLGDPKQLLKLNGKTLILLAVQKALKLSSNVIVVLGEKSKVIKKEIEHLPIKIAINSNYKEGMGSSIAFGVSQLHTTNKVLIMLGDQPLIPLLHFKNLIETSNKHEDEIICSEYKNEYAVPTIFPNKYFQALKKLKGDKGAKQLLKDNLIKSVILADCDSIDIDTKEEWDIVVNKARDTTGLQ